jgi:hypothetical protein
MIMQMMTDRSCVHRVVVDACAPTPTVLATVIVPPPIFVGFAPGLVGVVGLGDRDANVGRAISAHSTGGKRALQTTIKGESI